ncbi:MAG: fructosamine kinase family protein [Lachnospiraceae bacterium]|nr:fructosamine kinase family protein [Lachnospiraceae bacterium]
MRSKERLRLSVSSIVLIEPESPSLIHGDLWTGNSITGRDGKAWLIDRMRQINCRKTVLWMRC